MGVKDLWRLLEPAGRPVKLESLEGLVLAVDVSIWLNQAVKGMRDRHGNSIPQAHLVVLFNRICKLLYYHIKPVFVFDGATPTIKKQTLVARSRKRDTATQRSLKAADKQVTKFLQAKILEQIHGEKISVPQPPSDSLPSSSVASMFELPPLPDNALSKDKPPDYDSSVIDAASVNAYHEEVSALDIHSDDFSSLPPEVQHELLLERQQLEKHSHNDPTTLPQIADDFSTYQLYKLLTQSRTSQKLEEVRKVLKSNQTATMGLSGEANIHDVETSRILSSESAHYILVRGTDIDGQSSQDESTTEETEEDRDGGYLRDEIEMKSQSKNQDGSVRDLTSVGNGDKAVGNSDFLEVVDDLTILASESPDSSDKPLLGSTSGNILKDGQLSTNVFSELQNATEIGTKQQCLQTSEQLAPVVLSSQMSVEPKPLIDVDALIYPASALDQESVNIVEVNKNTMNKDVESTQTTSKEAEKLNNQPANLSLSMEKPEPQLFPPKEQDIVLTVAESSKVSTSSNHPYPVLNYSVDVHPPGVDKGREEREGSSPDLDWEGGREIDSLISLPLSEAQGRLGQDVLELERERARQGRAAAAVSNLMFKESQELLSLFGLPYLIAPTEAEAQCAYLDTAGLTRGTITDDNDVFLFGGRNMYRNFFSQDKELELFSSDEIESRLGLSRDHLIVLAYLLGSDYTEGLDGVGIVSAMELVRDFPGGGLEPLKKLKEWHEEAIVKPALVKKANGTLKKLCQNNLPDNFPDKSAYEAYHSPEVDSSSEQFEWGKPDLDLLRRFASEKIGWDQIKVDSSLLPVLKRMNARTSHQQPITHYLPRALPDVGPLQRKGIKSRRIRNVVARLTNTDPTSHSPNIKQLRTRRPKRGRDSPPPPPRLPSKQSRVARKTTKRGRHQTNEVEVSEPSSKITGFGPTSISASSSSSDSE